MRTHLASIAVLASLTALVPTTCAATAATASAAGDWRAAACADDDKDLATGSYAVAQVLTQPVKQVPSLTVTAERLVFANGARCDLLSLDGPVPVGKELTGYGSEMTVLGQLVVGGVDQGEMSSTRAVSGYGGSSPIARARHLVLGAEVFPAVESGTVPDSPTVPAGWRNQPYTSTHTRTTFTATVNGATGKKKTFTVTPATKAAAKRRLDVALALADTAAERRAARQTYRLALQGVRYVMKTFRFDWSGEIPR